MKAALAIALVLVAAREEHHQHATALFLFNENTCVCVGTRFLRHAGSNHSFKTFAAAIRACNNNKRGKCGGIYVQESSCQLLNATAFFPCYDNRTVTCVSLLTL